MTVIVVNNTMNRTMTFLSQFTVRRFIIVPMEAIEAQYILDHLIMISKLVENIA